jgi:DNA polymerase
MSERDDLVAHLRLYADMGVAGISRDPAWRERNKSELRTSNFETGGAQEGEALRSDSPAAGRKPDSSEFEVQSSKFEVVPTVMPQAPSPTPFAIADAAAFSELPMTPEVEALAALRTHIGVCTRCPLHALGRKQVVFGVGSPTAQLMFVGEGPGADEDEKGEPFVGQAGQLLTKIIAAIDLTRSDVYIANVVKCRPPGNRNPEPVEVTTCSPFLMRQIEIIRPKAIVALGAFAAQTLLQTKVPISKLRGHVHDLMPGTKVIPTFHPSFLLRNRNNRDLYRDVWEDVKKARAIILGTD